MLGAEGAVLDAVAREESAVDLTGRLADIDRQLLTRAPSALDGALLLVERKSVYEALYPEAGHGGDRKSFRYREIKTKTISFCSDAAARLGLSERAVQLAVSLGEALKPVADTLRNTPIADNAAALKTFTMFDEAARSGVLRQWRDNPKLSFKAALIAARIRAAEDADATQFQRLLDGWQRASAKVRNRFLTEIGISEIAAEGAATGWRKRAAK